MARIFNLNDDTMRWSSYSCEIFLALTVIFSCCCYLPMIFNNRLKDDNHQFNSSVEEHWALYRLTLVVAMSTSIPMSLDTILDYNLTLRSLLPRWCFVISLTIPNIVSFIVMNSTNPSYRAILACSVGMREILLRGALLTYLLHEKCTKESYRAITCAAVLSTFAVQSYVWTGFMDGDFISIWTIFANCIDGVATAIVIYLLVQQLLECRFSEHPCIYRSMYVALYILNYLVKSLVVASATSTASVSYLGVSDIFICVLATTIPGRQARNEKCVAEGMVNAKRDLLNYISHEIRTPLNAIYIGVQLLAKELHANSCCGDNSKNILDDIDSSCQMVIDILNEFLMVNRIEVGSLALDIKRVSVISLIDSVASTFDKQADQQGLKYTFNGDTHIDPELLSLRVGVDVDIAKIRHVLRNLISNALRFTPAGGRVDVYALLKKKSSSYVPLCDLFSTEDDFIKNRKPVHREKSDLQDYVLRVEVRDSGSGINEKDKTRLFQEVSSFGSSHLHNGGGAGLGMWVSKRIVDLHNGRMGVESEINKGSTFFIELNISCSSSTCTTQSNADDEESCLHSKRSEDYAEHAALLSPPFEQGTNRIGPVLVVDDSAVSRKMVCRLLGNRVARTDQAENGQVAVSKVQESMDGKSPYSLIFMDATMPEMGGIEAVTLIRRMGYAGVIVFLTGNSTSEDREKFLAAGANDVIIKPCTLKDILDVVSTDNGTDNVPRQHKLQSCVHLSKELHQIENG
mmetsp:Transcript_15331/g.23084  ORF Transcript_15331/g.23084 Transcript_15331/m.23084 type:complete len:743 (+) Transcript_15331:110-2338(+)|eukprot:CAMPEP_0185038430 /NCGR_PEP_ID=MMETSP1103-20130426/34057_1 /TAXON_ID=36769 /ORGANISM="Paraphysomonas bandaiensis, Strain Caron Lab Isolate" /LENGTH=742 /DNA_ID=CAMNT_0027576855 /DNA_START=59 /DNA_END=2287 /DNA_ORIENTATION=-